MSCGSGERAGPDSVARRAGAGPREPPPGAGRGHVCTQPPRRARRELHCLLQAQLPAAGARAAAQRAVSGARGGEPLMLRPGPEGTAPGCAGWAPGAGRAVLNPRRAVGLLPA